MTLVRKLSGGDWGRLRIGDFNVPVRGLAAVAGVTLWLLITMFQAGFDETLAAVAANAGFVAGLFLLASLTRTIGVVTVIRAFLLGALAMAIMLLLARPLAVVGLESASTVDPPLEELLKLSPLALLLWQGRRLWTWQLGATDILLIAVAAGAGFAVVEDAFIRMNEGWGETLPLLPTTEIYEDRIRGDRLIAGHAIWTAISGATIGLAWLMVRVRPLLVLAPMGILISTTDHIANNSQTMPALAPLVIVLFLAGVAGVVALDLYVLRQKLPSVPALESALAQRAAPLLRWRRMLESRRLRFAAWRMDRRPSTKVGGAERAMRRSVIELVDNPSR